MNDWKKCIAHVWRILIPPNGTKVIWTYGLSFFLPLLLLCFCFIALPFAPLLNYNYTATSNRLLLLLLFFFFFFCGVMMCNCARRWSGRSCKLTILHSLTSPLATRWKPDRKWHLKFSESLFKGSVFPVPERASFQVKILLLTQLTNIEQEILCQTICQTWTHSIYQ